MTPPISHFDHPEAKALMRAVLADPDDDTPRLIFADRLDEHGGIVGADRVAFIRLQCECTRSISP
jgi:uncharacterized protein (TIGR02996 family)